MELVYDIFGEAGMELPQPAQKGDLFDIASWHEQALTMDVEDVETGYTIANPGRFMEQLAGDIFSANIKSNLWGWADTRSTWMLDFWLNFDPRLYFVLVCVSPQQMLASAMSSQTKIGSVDEVIYAWQEHYQQLLRFHLRNPQRSLLIDARECAENPHKLIKRCAEQWKLQIAAPAIASSIYIAHDSLALYLAQQLCQDYPQTASLQHELAATLTRLCETEQPVNATPLSAEHIIADYRALRDRSAEMALLQAAREELEAYFLKHESTQKQNDILYGEVAILTTAHNEQSKLAAELQTEIDQLAKKHDDILAGHAQQQKDAEARLKDAEQENALLLLQLHQVQEELEAYFLKHESAQKQNGTLQGEVAILTTAHNEQSKLAAELQAKIDQLTKKHDDAIADHAQQQQDAETRLKDAEQEIALLLLQLQQVQEELKAYFLKYESAQKQNDTIAGHAQQQKDAEARLKDAEQENELLLLQLHQVQEELEHYFLQHQDKQRELQNTETRWQRMLQRNPDYCDYESIEVFPAENDEDNATIWRLKNLNAAGRSLPEIEFKTIIEQGVAGFVFFRKSGIDGMLTRWPANAATQDELTIIPIGKDDILQQRIETLLDLATSDWNLLHVLTRLLEGILEQPSYQAIPVGFNAEPLHAGLGRLREVIEKFPAIFRYDQVALKREQVNPDYEHLWLRFNNVVFGNKRWPEFEFRLSCANVRPNHFGAYPKLEFPEEACHAHFEGWFIESYDDFGAKLELRFALPESMDMDVLQRISAGDRGFLSVLIVRLPAILTTLQNNGVQLKRPWEDWIKMAKEMQRIYVLRIAPHPAPAEIQAKSGSEEPVLANPTVAASAKPKSAVTTNTRKIK
ncbi:hypothetical protein [Methylobacter sp.]|uniref:hypothetical protein n=2 Tax=Methylobacter sp. TaxID=2051955 RepID=UPI002FE09A66